MIQWRIIWTKCSRSAFGCSVSVQSALYSPNPCIYLVLYLADLASDYVQSAALLEVKEETAIPILERDDFFIFFSLWHAGQDPGGLQLSLLIVVGFFQAHVYSARISQKVSHKGIVWHCKGALGVRVWCSVTSLSRFGHIYKYRVCFWLAHLHSSIRDTRFKTQTFIFIITRLTEVSQSMQTGKTVPLAFNLNWFCVIKT